jgi:hypothetical protein
MQISGEGKYVQSWVSYASKNVPSRLVAVHHLLELILTVAGSVAGQVTFDFRRIHSSSLVETISIFEITHM